MLSCLMILEQALLEKAKTGSRPTRENAKVLVYFFVSSCKLRNLKDYRNNALLLRAAKTLSRCYRRSMMITGILTCAGLTTSAHASSLP